MKILVPYPSRSDLSAIVDRTIQKDESRPSSPVLDREEILDLRGVCHQVSGRARTCRITPSIWSWPRSPTPAKGTSWRASSSATEVRRAARRRWWNADASALSCNGRLHLSIEDVDAVAPAVLRHRIILNFDAHADGQTPETILSKIIPSVGRRGRRAVSKGISQVAEPLIDTPMLEKLERLTIHWQKSQPRPGRRP